MRRTHMTAPYVVAAVLLWMAHAPAPAAEPEEGVLRFEAEDYSSPANAWMADQRSDSTWCLWSTDVKKAHWSGNVVLQSPPVTADRDRGGDGAPVLHTVLTEIPTGTYTVKMSGSGRPIGVSLDGDEWRKCNGGVIAPRARITDGRFELWVDDRFAHDDPAKRGSCYYDYLDLIPLDRERRPVEIANAGFESGEGASAEDWRWWSRTDTGGGARTDSGAHAGTHCVRITYDDDKDWNYINGTRVDVTPGQRYEVGAWVKVERGGVYVSAVALSGSDTLSWNIGKGARDGPCEWTRISGHVTVPDRCDRIYVRFGGKGATRVLVDDVTLVRLTTATERTRAGDGCFLRAGDVVLFLGDAITLDGAYQRLARARIDREYPSLAGRDAGGLRFASDGASGRTARQCAAQVDRLLARHRPTVCVVFFGANDFHADADEFASNVRSIVKKLDAAGVAATLVAPLALDTRGRGELTGWTRTVEHMANDIRAIAAAERLPVADCHAVFSKAMSTGDDDLSWGDGIHPTERGHELIAQALLDAWRVGGPLQK